MRAISLTITFCVSIAAFVTGCAPAADVRLSTTAQHEISSGAININSADSPELQRIPYIGEKLALSIIEHRERFGPFRKTEHLLLINGVSDKRFREIRHLIRVD